MYNVKQILGYDRNVVKDDSREPIVECVDHFYEYEKSTHRISERRRREQCPELPFRHQSKDSAWDIRTRNSHKPQWKNKMAKNILSCVKHFVEDSSYAFGLFKLEGWEIAE